MQLETQSARDGYNIDSFERALVYSALLLRAGYNDSANERTLRNRYAIRQVSQNLRQDNDTFLYQGFANIQAVMEYDNLALTSGGDLLGSLVESVSSDVPYTGVDLTPSARIIAPIANDIAKISTLEDYFLWSVINYQNALVNPLPTDAQLLSYVSINPNYTGINDNPTINITATVEYNYTTWLESFNLVNAVGFFPNIPVTGQSGLIGSGILIGSGLGIISGVNAN